MIPERLVDMANQIAANVPDQQHAAAQAAAHLRSFWSPSMIDELAAAALRDPDRVAPAVRQALVELRPRT